MLLTVDQFILRIGASEAEQIAGTGPRDMRVLDRDRVETELDAATGIIAGYVLARYPLAVDHPNEMLRGWCADIARWRLRGQGGPQSQMAEVVKQRYDEAMRGLRDVQAGRLALDLPTPQADASEAANAGVNTRVLASSPLSRVASTLEGY